MWSCRLEDAQQTRLLGRRIGAIAEHGTVLALSGELGAGKTCLAQGVGEGLGVSGPVTSPTFIILAIYEDGRLPLYHADLYRIGGEDELQELGLEEALSEGGVAVVEWAERFPELLPDDHLALSLEHDGDARLLSARASGTVAARLLERIRS